MRDEDVEEPETRQDEPQPDRQHHVPKSTEDGTGATEANGDDRGSADQASDERDEEWHQQQAI